MTAILKQRRGAIKEPNLREIKQLGQLNTNGDWSRMASANTQQTRRRIIVVDGPRTLFAQHRLTACPVQIEGAHALVVETPLLSPWRLHTATI